MFFYIFIMKVCFKIKYLSYYFNFYSIDIYSKKSIFAKISRFYFFEMENKFFSDSKF